MKAATSLLLTAALCFFIFAVMLTAGCANGAKRQDLNASPTAAMTKVPAAAPDAADEEMPQQPETICGVAPVDWVDSD